MDVRQPPFPARSDGVGPVRVQLLPAPSGRYRLGGLDHRRGDDLLRRVSADICPRAESVFGSRDGVCHAAALVPDSGGTGPCGVAGGVA